jgi:hypothetical protein
MLLLLSLLGCPADDDAKLDCEAESSCKDGAWVDCNGDVLETCADDEVCVAEVGCTTCTPTLTPAVGVGTTLTLETGGSGLVRARAVDVALSGDVGDVKLVTEGPVEVVDASGARLDKLTTLPATVYLRATGVGAGSLTAGFSGSKDTCPEDARLDIRAVAPAPLTGRARVQAPGWESVDSYWDVDPVTVGLDPARHADRVVLPYDVYVVAHRSAEEWAADPTLGTAVTSGTVTAGAFNTLPVWTAPELLTDTLSEAWDVVLDFDGDAQLGPDDLVDGWGEDYGFVRIADLGMTGPHAVEQEDDSGGMWLGERIYWPTDLAALGPRPLVVISHGNGHDYTWYDYIGQHLASWGYIVMSHQNNTGPGIDTASNTTLRNTDYLLANTATLVGGALDGLVDGERIAWIGHSRGGEGVTMAYDKLVEGRYTSDVYTAEDIRVIASIAPTEIGRASCRERVS